MQHVVAGGGIVSLSGRRAPKPTGILLLTCRTHGVWSFTPSPFCASVALPYTLRTSTPLDPAYSSAQLCTTNGGGWG